MRITLLFIYILCFTSIAFAKPSVEPTCLEWDKNPTNATMGITSYRVSWSTISGSYTDADSYVTLDAVNSKACFADMIGLGNPDNKYYVVSVINLEGESEYGNEAYKVPFALVVPGAVSGTRLSN